MEDKILIDSNLDMNDQNIKSIILKLSSKYSNQEYFIKIIKDNIKQAKLGNNDAIIKLEKLSCILPKVIEELGLPFSDLLNNNNEILNYYIDNCIHNKNIEISKTIIINFIETFNFKLTETNPIDDIKERLKNANIDIKNISKEKRQAKKLIETIYDELEELYTTWKTIFSKDEGLELEEHYSDILQASLKEKKDKIKTIENQNLYSKATIEFLKEKLKKIEDFTIWGEVQKVGKSKIKIKTPQYSINKNKPKIDEKEKENKNENNIINTNWLTEEERKKLREIELKNRTFFYKNEYLAYGEDQSTEFKNYFYPLEPDQEKEIKRQYIGFLNSEGGRIYIGINDQKIVKGIILTYKNCDNYRNSLVGLSNDFYPKCRLNKIKVYFIPIKNSFNNKFINNLFVVKIIILPGDPYSLYSITKKGGFISAIRRQSQVFNLDAEEIANEIIGRNLKRCQGNQINVPDINLIFNDPEPEQNLEVSKYDVKSLELKSDKNISNINNKNGKKDQKLVFIVNVKNIDKNLKVKEINKLFNGLQQSYQKFFAKEGKSLGYGKLQFNNEEAAKEAIKKFNGNNLGGKRNVVMSLEKK